MAVLLSDFVWEGTNPERLAGVNARDGQIYKELDTGESYLRRNGEWHFINLGLSFIKATKSGTAVTDASGHASIAFTTPFIDDQYTVQLTMPYPGSKLARIAWSDNVATTGFDIVVTDGKGDPISTAATVDWLTTRDYDP